MNAGFDNALADGTPPSATAARPVHRTHRFRLLLQRELWEHKGGFVWAPVIAGLVFLFVTLMGVAVGEAAMRHGDGNVTVNGREISIASVDLGSITSHMSPHDIREFGQGLNGALYVSAGWSLLVFGFVVFFYCLGALYDERRDRSVLFWKSMPVSDSETVLSKLATALVVGPLLALGAGLATMLGFLLLVGAFAMLHGANPITLVWGPADPLTVIANLAGSLPVYVLWALPTAGWLMLCSSWARSKPFLWAIIVPIMAGVLLGWFDLMGADGIDNGWYWQNVAGRLLFGTWPGTTLAYVADQPGVHGHDVIESMGPFAGLAANWELLLRPAIWIGAIAGVAMIFGAIRLRRYRDDN